MTNETNEVQPLDALAATRKTLTRKVEFLIDKWENHNGGARVRQRIEDFQWVIELIDLNNGTVAARPEIRSFHAEYRWQGGWGAYREIDAIVNAANKPSALVKVLAEYPGTSPDDWIVKEIDTANEGVIHITGSSS